MGKKNLSLDFSQKKTADQSDEKSQIYLHSAHVCKPENHNGCRGDRGLVNTRINNFNSDLVYNFQGRTSDMEKYDRTGRCAKSGSTNKQVGRFDERIHKRPVERQDSTTLDIGLDDSVHILHELGKQAIRIDKHGATELMLSTLVPTDNTLSLQRHQLETDHQIYKSLHGINTQFERANLACAELRDTSITNEQISKNSMLFPGCQVPSIETSRSESGQLLSQASHGSSPGLVEIRKHSAGKKVKIFFEDEPVNFAKDLNEEGKSRNGDSLDKESKSRDDDSLDKEGGKTWGWPSVTKQEAVMAAMFVVVLVLTMTVLRLHARVEAVERRCQFSSVRRCRGCKDSVIYNRDVASIKSVGQDVYTQILQYLANDEKELTTEGSISTYLPAGYYKNKNEQFRGTHFPEKVQTNNMSPTNSKKSLFDGLENVKTDEDITIFKSRTLENLNDGLFQSSSNASSLDENNEVDEKSAEITESEVNVYPSTIDVRIVELLQNLQDKAGQAHSRVVRSTDQQDKTGQAHSRAVRSTDQHDKAGQTQSHTARTPQKEIDPHINANKRKRGGNKGGKGHKGGGGVGGGGQEEGGGEGEHRSGGKKKGHHSSKAESYEARFFENFPYSQHFMEQECTEQHRWKKGIKACKEATVNLLHKYSVLPFYMPTNETAQIDVSKRMLLIEDDKPGEFVVNIAGDYLVQLNITIVVEKPEHDEKHFLALHLNGQAMLACHQGGFRCPNMNRTSEGKYKICNIIGLLELRKDDILDIRTMDGNMTVRMERHLNTYFRVLLLNKTK